MSAALSCSERLCDTRVSGIYMSPTLTSREETGVTLCRHTPSSFTAARTSFLPFPPSPFCGAASRGAEMRWFAERARA